jgi:hypothetical protein
MQQQLIAQAAADNRQWIVLHQRGQLGLGSRHRNAVKMLSEVKRL